MALVELAAAAAAFPAVSLAASAADTHHHVLPCPAPPGLGEGQPAERFRSQLPHHRLGIPRLNSQLPRLSWKKGG